MATVQLTETDLLGFDPRTERYQHPERYYVDQNNDTVRYHHIPRDPNYSRDYEQAQAYHEANYVKQPPSHNYEAPAIKQPLSASEQRLYKQEMKAREALYKAEIAQAKAEEASLKAESDESKFAHLKPAKSVTYDNGVPYDTRKKFKVYDGEYEHGKKEPEIESGDIEEEIEEDLFDELEDFLREDIKQEEDKQSYVADVYTRFMSILEKIAEENGVSVEEECSDDEEELADHHAESQGELQRLCRGCGSDISYAPIHHTVCRRCYR